MFWLIKQLLSDSSKIWVMNFLFSVHSLWLFHYIIYFLQLSYFPVDQWFTNLTWYQSLVQARSKSCLIFIVHQKQLSFHVNSAIFSLLTLDSSLEASTVVTDSEKVHMSRWKGLNWHMIANWIGFAVFFAGTYVASWIIDWSTYKNMENSLDLVPRILTPFN